MDDRCAYLCDDERMTFLIRSRLALTIALVCGCHATGPAAKACTPPRDYWQKPAFIGGLDAPFSQISIGHDDHVYVDGRPVSDKTLQHYLAQMQKVGPPRYDAFLEVEMGASCEKVEQVRDRMDQILRCRVQGNCAEGSRAIWSHLPLKPGENPG